MKFLKFVFLGIFLIVLSGCGSSTNEEVTNTNPGINDRELLEKAAQEFLEEKEKEKGGNDTANIDFDPRTDSGTTRSNTNPNIEEPSIKTVSSIGESNANFDDNLVEDAEDSDTNVDIIARDLDIDLPSNFDLDDDEIEFTVDLRTIGLDDGDFFNVEILIFRNEDEKGKCDFIYVVGDDDTDEGCEIDDVPNYGDYEAEVYVDSKDRFQEVNERNNFLDDDFDVDE